MTSAARRIAALVDDYLLVWVLLAVAIGLVVPSLASLTPLSTPILAVMIGSVSLTLSPERFGDVRGRPLLTILVVGATMPFAGFAIATAMNYSPAVTAGFVVLGAVTPELVTPVMTELSDGDTALATSALVLVGLGTVGFVPVIVALLLGGTVQVDSLVIVEELAVAVVLPMVAAVATRWRWPARVIRYEEFYTSVSASMVVLIIGIVAAANASLITSGGRTLVAVLAGAIALNGFGYAIGWVSGHSLTRPERIATTLSVGMRDFAVAAALLVAAGFPPTATLPAVVFGIVEMTTSAGLARRFRE